MSSSAPAIDKPSPGIRAWMDANLAVQGFDLSSQERRALWLGVRFSTGVCLALVIPALVVGSAGAFAALAVIGAVAGFSSRHPFDHVWNRLVRHAFGAPSLPPSPRRRRHAFKVATLVMLTITGLFAAGLSTAAVVVGILLIASCSAVTITNLCIPSMALAIIENRRSRGATQPATSEGS